ncbi:MAG: hypothetical protein KGJ13_12655 [Patescibacteria group bacterium]|nr:hypothetical protein [Patescibacteria group bacterium]
MPLQENPSHYNQGSYVMAEEKKAAPKRSHKAGYARDKLKGGYIIRVQGPHAASFAGRQVPVTSKDGAETMEQLTDLIWSGMDDGKVSGYVGHCALYHFEARPRGEEDEILF